tara:strand:+ start:113 stop:298 length:186 start_codon:yes stop_codon:yes gene_type:complete
MAIESTNVSCKVEVSITISLQIREDNTNPQNKRKEDMASNPMLGLKDCRLRSEKASSDTFN